MEAPTHGRFMAGIPRLLATRSRRIAVLATEGTVRGGAYQREILRRLPGAQVVAVPATLTEVERHAGVRERFTTRNDFQRPSFMTMKLVDGPFRLLEGRWTFTPIGEAGTRVELEMRFEFANPMVSLLFGKSFEESCGRLIDAFVARARQLHVGG